MVFETNHEKGPHHALNLVVFIISGCIVVGLYVPIICYHLFKFYQMRNAPFLQNRFPLLTILSVLAIVGVLFFGSLFGMLFINSFDHIGLLLILVFIMAHGSVFCHSFMLRIWLLYFTVRVNKAIANDVWQSIINPTINIQDHPNACENPNAFVLQNKATYGNFEWTTKRLRKAITGDILFLLLFFGIMYLCSVSNVDQTVINVLFLSFVVLSFVGIFFVPLIGITVLYKNIPEFYDHLHLRHELVFLSRSYMLCVPVFVIATTGIVSDQLMVFDREGEDSLWYLVAMTIDWQITAFIMFFVSMRMVYVYPNKLFALYMDTTTPKTMPHYKQIADGVQTQKRVKITDVFKHGECFEVLIEHLAREYCMESLLSMIEITQFRDCILQNEPQLQQIYGTRHPQSVSSSESLVLSNTESTGKMVIYHELPHSIVKSDIVYPDVYTERTKCGHSVEFEEYLKTHRNEDKEERIAMYKTMAYRIYHKYVRPGAEYEINIGYALRMRYVSLMNTQESWMDGTGFGEAQLCSLFDDCYNEMMHLMQQTFARFKKSDKFEQITAVLQL
eukprot:271444_1